jgi:hypothetical protein
VTTGSIARAGARPVTEIRSGDGIFDLELDSVREYRELLFFPAWRETVPAQWNWNCRR